MDHLRRLFVDAAARAARNDKDTIRQLLSERVCAELGPAAASSSDSMPPYLVVGAFMAVLTWCWMAVPIFCASGIDAMFRRLAFDGAIAKSGQSPDRAAKPLVRLTGPIVQGDVTTDYAPPLTFGRKSPSFPVS